MDQWVFIPSSPGTKCMERHFFQPSYSMDVSVEGCVSMVGTIGKDRKWACAVHFVVVGWGSTLGLSTNSGHLYHLKT